MGLLRERFGGPNARSRGRAQRWPVENASGRAFGERQAQGLAAVREIIGAGGQGEALDEGDPRAVAPEGAHGRGERGEASWYSVAATSTGVPRYTERSPRCSKANSAAVRTMFLGCSDCP